MSKKNGFLVMALGTICVFAMSGCFNASRSNVRTPYGESTAHTVCVAGNCRSVVDQEQVAMVDTRGYDACVEAFTADNDAGLAICEEGVTGCRYSQTQIMDACAFRAAILNGGQFGMGSQYGAMPFGQFMPLFTGGYFGNPGAIAGYDMQRQSVLYGPRYPNLPPESQTAGGMSDDALEREIIRRAEARAAGQ